MQTKNKQPCKQIWYKPGGNSKTEITIIFSKKAKTLSFHKFTNELSYP